jgi:hypothetical protein
MKRVPFSKPAASQYRIPAFYFRGGDVLREREYLADEYRKALGSYRRAALTLRQIEADLKVADRTLNEREGFTNALSNFLAADAEGNRTEQDYKQRLMRVESEIKDLELELQQARAVHHPAVCAGLQKEKAYWQIEVQRTQKAGDLAGEQRDADKRRLVELTVSRRYQTSWDLETKALDLSRKNQFLRAQEGMRRRAEAPAAPDRRRQDRARRLRKTRRDGVRAVARGREEREEARKARRGSRPFARGTAGPER